MATTIDAVVPATEAPLPETTPVQLQIGLNENLSVVLVVSDSQSIVFNPSEAKNLGFHLIQKAIESEIYTQQKAAQAAAVPATTE